jgi:protoheme IX farnesyltransferase
MIKTYYQLTKPGIIYGNAITAMAGFFLAERGHFHLRLFIAMLLGLSLVIASGCVFNNIMDKDIDAKMARTKNRAMVIGAIKDSHASTFGFILVICGLGILALFASHVAAIVAFIGFAVYVRAYTPLKRKTVWATLIGAVAGATPPVIGYTAVSGRLDAAAVILFLILIFWQMPHFYAIAIRRLEDYKAANIPVLPVKKGLQITKAAMLLYCAGFVISTLLLTVYKYTGTTYLVVALILGLTWLAICARGFTAKNSAKWAKQTFLFSLITLTLLSLAISVL